jgi:hypothetical protein
MCLRYLPAKGAMQNINILIETDELVAGPAAAKELKLHFSTLYQWIKKGEVFSFPIHSVDYLRIRSPVFKDQNE